MSNIHNIDNVLIKVEPRMRKINIETCRQAGVAHGNTVELDALLVNNLKLSVGHTDKETRWLQGLFVLQLVFDFLMIYWMNKH